MIKAVIFDIGGVEVNNVKIKDFWKNKSRSKKIRYDFGTGKLTIKQFIKKGGQLLCLPEKEFLKEYKKAYDKIKTHKGVIKIFKKIKLNKYILSDNNPLHTQFIKESHKEIFKTADKVFLSQKMGMRKDKVATFKFVLKKIKRKPGETVMIDDEESNLRHARKLGMRTILFKNARQLKKDLKKFGINI